MSLEQEVCDFVDSSPTPNHFVSSARSLLSGAGFVELHESETWSEIPDKFFVTRDDRTMIAIHKADLSYGAFLGSNIDTPCFRGKPNTRISHCGCEQVRVAPYGKSGWWGWLDRGLSAAGRVAYLQDNKFRMKLFKTEDAIAVIPSLSVHLNRASGTDAKFNQEDHFVPIVGISPDEPLPDGSHSQFLLEAIAQAAEIEVADIIDFDVTFYDSNGMKVIGMQKDMLAGARITNVATAFLGLKAFVEAERPKKGLRGIVLFDSELIGGKMRTGSKSNFVSSVLKRMGCPEEFTRASTFVGLDTRRMAGQVMPGEVLVGVDRRIPVILKAIERKRGAPIRRETRLQSNSLAARFDDLGMYTAVLYMAVNGMNTARESTTVKSIKNMYEVLKVAYMVEISDEVE